MIKISTRLKRFLLSFYFLKLEFILFSTDETSKLSAICKILTCAEHKSTPIPNLSAYSGKNSPSTYKVLRFLMLRFSLKN